MTPRPNPSRRGLIWAAVGALVLVLGIVAVIVGSVVSQSPPSPAPSGNPSEGSRIPTPTIAEPDGEVVDPTAEDRGWTPEPITTDAETYIRAALAAASTFDTTKATRDEWLEYLDSWFTPDTRYGETDRPARMKAAQLELRQGVVLPQQDWDSLAGEDGRVVAAAAGEVEFVPVTEDPSGDMSIGTADVALVFTRSDGGDGAASYEESVRVSVQVLCGEGSVPTPDSAQTVGDCKVVRYFTEPLEP
ncbi:hypothetical protein ACLQ2Q_15460 [Microbacterium sp. DT81.1]|uniref:hypothetical protein n=1 Tax=Microbacterium sp. DT81.1 TaxID=3393413 RepID=UPI003CEC7D8B